MEPDDAGVRSFDEGGAAPGRHRGILVGVVVLGVVAVAAVVAGRWWRTGGARRSVKHLAEAGAVALADVLVDELLPAA